jgi:hypothetical protein
MKVQILVLYIDSGGSEQRYGSRAPGNPFKDISKNSDLKLTKSSKVP